MNPRHSHLTHETMHRLTVDTEPWLSCDDCFDVMDQYVEQLLRDSSDGRPADISPDAMATHLAACSACAEEATSLLLLVAADAGIDPAPALQRLYGA